MAAVTRHVYEIRVRRPRLTLGDGIVLIGALVAFLIGWAVKDWHDDRLRSVDVNGVTVAYPKNWIRFPTREPEVFRAVSIDDGRTAVFLATATTPLTDVLQAVATAGVNPARGEPGYTQLGNKSATVDGIAAVSSDYAYVQSAVGGTTVPTVIRGRQFSWIKDGQLYSFAVEGPEDQWSQIRSQANRFVDEIDSGA